MKPSIAEKDAFDLEQREKTLQKLKFCIIQNYQTQYSRNRLQFFVMDILPSAE